MTNIIEKYEQEQIEKLTAAGKPIPEFKAGDTLAVNVRISEGKTERIQRFEGVCIAVKNRGLNSSFIVRKISHGESVERIFPLYSPKIESIKVVRRGIVRRAKLYYMRNLQGKAARIKERKDFLSNSGNNKKANAKKEAKAVKANEADKADTAKVAEATQAAPEQKDAQKQDDK